MFFLAIRHLFARKRQTILTLLGILLGTAAFIAISGLLLGFREYFVDQLINNDLQVKISAKEDRVETHSLDTFFFKDQQHVFWTPGPSGVKEDPKINNPQKWYRILNQDPDVAGYSPQLTSQIILTRAGASSVSKLVGCYPDKQIQVTNIAKNMVQGKFSDIQNGGNKVLMGDDLRKKLGANLYETILISNGKNAPAPFKIVGTFKTGIAAVDESTVFAHISDAQRINQTPSKINTIAIKLYSVDIAREKAQSWSLLSEEKVQSWDEINKSFLNVFQIQDTVRYMMTAAILIVAGFSIYNILNMVITQKRKEIAILRSMGYEPLDIVKLFLIQGVILGIVGGALGVMLGYVVCLKLSTVKFGGGPLGKGTGVLTISFQVGIYIRSFLLSFFAALIASYIPARSAGKMTPIEIIRSES